jgi:hypothetical protein
MANRFRENKQCKFAHDNAAKCDFPNQIAILLDFARKCRSFPSSSSWRAACDCRFREKREGSGILRIDERLYS